MERSRWFSHHLLITCFCLLVPGCVWRCVSAHRGDWPAQHRLGQHLPAVLQTPAWLPPAPALPFLCLLWLWGALRHQRTHTGEQYRTRDGGCLATRYGMFWEQEKQKNVFHNWIFQHFIHDICKEKFIYRLLKASPVSAHCNSEYFFCRGKVFRAEDFALSGFSVIGQVAFFAILTWEKREKKEGWWRNDSIQLL